MKKIGIGLLLLFLFLAGLYAVVQSNIGRKYIQNTLTRALQESGFQVTIDQLEGTIPHQIDLKGVSIQGNGIDVGVAELKLRPVIWRLFKKELAFQDVQAKGISISQGEPFDFSGKFRLNAKKAFLKGVVADWKVTAVLNRITSSLLFTSQNDLLHAKGKANFSPQFELLSSNIQIGSDQFLSRLPFEAAGRFLANIHIQQTEMGYGGRASWQIPNLSVENKKVGLVKGAGDLSLQARTLTGSFIIEPFAKALFDLTLSLDGILTGTSEIDIANLQSLHIPNIYGQLQAKANWQLLDGSQGVEVEATATDFYYKELSAQKIVAHSQWSNPFQKLKGPINIEAVNLNWNQLSLNAAKFETALGEGEAPFTLVTVGNLKHPFELIVDGTWDEGFSVDVENLNGTVLGTPIHLEKPVFFEKTEEVFQLSEVELKVGYGTAYLKIDREKEATDARIRLVEIPLDFLSINPLDVQIGGTVSLNAFIKETNNKLRGDLEASIHQTAPFEAEGNFQGSFNRDLLNLQGNLAVHEKPLLNMDLSIPIRFSIWPFDAEILFHKESRGKIGMNGRIEEFLDFLDIGPHRLEGHCEGELQFSNTLYRPLVQGQIFFKEGSYENYYSGTQLKNIEAEFFAEKNILYLRKLTAQDQLGSGTLAANGQIHLLQSDLYPFRLDLALDQLQFVQIDLVDATAQGKMRIEGNALSAIAKGDLLIQKCALTIPDHIPRPLPHLDVVYRNPTHPLAPPEKSYKPYPLYLDLKVLAPTDVTISGRGLESEWKGDFHLGGTYNALAAKGKLELINGEFNFSTRSFKLTEGSLSLSGIEHQMPHLNIAATTETKGIQITARLSGPIDDPQIVLQSSPPLPLGSIMSYLLFGQDISEIGGFQALQIATSLASLAGTGADVMEDTRKSLGVDRLRVISDPTDEGGETVAIEVGKYVSKGVLVTLTQGTEESSTNIRVEIELKNNFVFQIESDQHQEQGKFTLKWNLNY